LDIELKEKFIGYWKEYFDDAELPIVFYYSDIDTINENKSTKFQCLIGDLNRVRAGTSLRFGVDSIGCPGGRKYLGFTDTISEDLEYFLSCGIPGKLEGERYKKSPEIARNFLQRQTKFKAPKKYIVFKRWDQISEHDDPEVVIFYCKPDVLAGLFTLAGFDDVEDNIMSPFGSGCMTIITYPYAEREKETPKCFIGMFDPSARPYVQPDKISFAAPMKKFMGMIENMPESFLITPTWEKIKQRITK
jgi:hypothetical protein